MSGRRSHPRFALANPWDGSLQVARDVVVDRAGGRELVVLSHLPGVVGEHMSLGLMGAGASLELKVTVLESQPVVVEGSVRYRLRLALAARPEMEEPLAGLEAGLGSLETR